MEDQLQSPSVQRKVSRACGIWKEAPVRSSRVYNKMFPTSGRTTDILEGRCNRHSKCRRQGRKAFAGQVILGINTLGGSDLPRIRAQWQNSSGMEQQLGRTVHSQPTGFCRPKSATIKRSVQPARSANIGQGPPAGAAPLPEALKSSHPDALRRRQQAEAR